MRGRRRVCVACSTALEQPTTGRPRRYCSAACRQRAYAARRRRQPRNDWHTPAALRDRVLAEYTITLDAAATASSALVGNYLGPDHSNPARRDALTLPHWADLAGSGTVWLNPPYLPSSILAAFLERAAATAHAGVDTLALVPASTGTSWWWRCVVESGAEVEFLRGRLAFEGPHSTPGQPAPWASALVLWKAER